VHDPVKAPAHYAGDGVTTCKVALRSMMKHTPVRGESSYWWGCVFKYVWRWPLKNGLQDLKKARESLDILIELQEAEIQGIRDNLSSFDFKPKKKKKRVKKWLEN
jgi:hypothetical protein